MPKTESPKIITAGFSRPDGHLVNQKNSVKTVKTPKGSFMRTKFQCLL